MEITESLKLAGIRCEVDRRDEKLGYKIREAQMDKVPYMLILGQKEQEEHGVSVRKRDEGDLGAMSLEEFISSVRS